MELYDDRPADDGVIGRSLAELGFALPNGYVDFLRKHNGLEGFIGDKYITLWKAKELIPFNREYEVDKYAPGILLFGSSGGGEGYGFDTQAAEMPIVRVPFIGMDRRHSKVVARGFAGLFATFVECSGNGNVGDRSLPKGMELFEITPVLLGGDPSDPKNKIWLTRQQHFEAVRFWNGVVDDLCRQA
ncbi:MAG TPA: SMI1/KNR4 family protein [Xanthobacteraceae bacterium]|nr:SMI1/KNR4 family protein [Xanthobacteraceae bacterium]